MGWQFSEARGHGEFRRVARLVPTPHPGTGQTRVQCQSWALASPWGWGWAEARTEYWPIDGTGLVGSIATESRVLVELETNILQCQ